MKTRKENRPIATEAEEPLNAELEEQKQPNPNQLSAEHREQRYQNSSNLVERKKIASYNTHKAKSVNRAGFSSQNNDLFMKQVVGNMGKLQGVNLEKVKSKLSGNNNFLSHG